MVLMGKAHIQEELRILDGFCMGLRRSLSCRNSIFKEENIEKKKKYANTRSQTVEFKCFPCDAICWFVLVFQRKGALPF